MGFLVGFLAGLAMGFGLMAILAPQQPPNPERAA